MPRIGVPDGSTPMTARVWALWPHLGVVADPGENSGEAGEQGSGWNEPSTMTTGAA